VSFFRFTDPKSGRNAKRREFPIMNSNMHHSKFDFGNRIEKFFEKYVFGNSIEIGMVGLEIRSDFRI